LLFLLLKLVFCAPLQPISVKFYLGQRENICDSLIGCTEVL